MQPPAPALHHRVNEQPVLVDQVRLDQRVAQHDAAGHLDPAAVGVLHVPGGGEPVPARSATPGRPSWMTPRTSPVRRRAETGIAVSLAAQTI